MELDSFLPSKERDDREMTEALRLFAAPADEPLPAQIREYHDHFEKQLNETCGATQQLLCYRMTTSQMMPILHPRETLLFSPEVSETSRNLALVSYQGRLMVKYVYAPDSNGHWSLSPDDGSNQCIMIDDPASFRIYGLVHVTITPPMVSFPHQTQKITDRWADE